jgi:hypothetical protein
VSTILALAFLGGVAIGLVVDRWFDRRFWRRMAMRVHAQAPMSTTPPVVAELREPGWGPNLIGCPDCNGAAMSQVALAEHMRIRHGDS